MTPTPDPAARQPAATPVGVRPRGASLHAIWASVTGVLGALGRNRVRWAAPLVAVLLLLAIAVALLALVPAIAPFVYPLL